MSTVKTFQVALDLKQSGSNREFEVVEGDTGNRLHIVLTDGGEPVDLTGCGVIAAFSTSRGTVSQYSGTDGGGVTLGGEEGNEVDIELFTGSFAPGLVECELQIYSGQDYSVQVTSAKFNFSCRRSIYNSDTLPVEREYSLLSALLGQVEGAITTMHSTVDTAIEELKEAAYHADNHAADGVDPVTPGSIGAAVTREFTVSLPVSGWAGSAAPYTQQVSCALSTADRPILSPVLSATAATAKLQLAAWQEVCSAEAGTGTLSFRCLYAKPGTALTVLVKVVS